MQRRCASGLLALAGLLACSLPAQGAAKPRPAVPRLAFSGLHGGVFQTLQQKAAGLPVRLDYVTNAEIAAGTVDFSVYRVVIVQHFRAKLRDRYRLLFKVARERRPDLRIFSLTGSGLDLFEKKLVQQDPALSRYYRSPSPANLRRLLVFVLATYCGLDLEVEPPEKAPFFGLYHPDHQGLFDDAREFLAWAKRHHRDLAAPRAAIAVHNIHLEFQQPKVVEALIRALERRGALAVAVVDAGEGLDALRERYEQNLRELHCGAVVHTCHSPDTVAFREELGVPHLHSIFFTGKSIRQWRESVEGLDPGSYAFQVASQEMLGAIEPQVGAGTEAGGGQQRELHADPRAHRAPGQPHDGLAASAREA